MELTDDDLSEIAASCRNACNRLLYNREAPNDSNALTEVYPVRDGFAFTIHDEQAVVLVLPMVGSRVAGLAHPDYSRFALFGHD